MAAVKNVFSLEGRITKEKSLSGAIKTSASLQGSVHVSATPEAVPKYEGETTVTPKVESDVTLPTKNKLLKENISVLKIPQFEVSNTSGGYTLIIGEEYYNNGN